MIPFNFHHLYYFYTIAREGSVTRAARALKVGQPALSTQVRTFEEALGAKLFERDGRRLALTEEGRAVLSHAEEIFESGRQMLSGLAGGSAKGQLHTRIGLTAYVPKSIAERLIGFLFELDPGMRLEAAEDNLAQLLPRLERHELDCVLADEPAGGSFPKIETHLIDRVAIALAATPELARRYPRVPKDLNGAPMILPTSNSRIYSELREYFAAHGARPRIVAEVQDVELVRRMALSGLGIAPMNVYTLTHAPGHEKLVMLGRSPLPLHRPVYLFTMPRKRPHPLLGVLLKKFRFKD
jgi:LysR family transcriptional activator of nhaA